MTPRVSRRSVLRCAGLTLAAMAAASCTTVQPDRTPRLTVLVSGAFQHTLEQLAPAYAKQSGVEISIVRGPSMGESPTAIPQRLERHEDADVVILARDALDRLAAARRVVPESETDLVLSKIAMAVKEGAPAPDISNVEALRQALLAAHSVAYSDSASGVYISSELFPKLGVAEQMQAKARMIQATPVGLVVSRGEAEIGFQQLSELKPIAGIHIVGLLPEGVQKVTRFSAAIVSYSQKRDQARKLIEFLDSDSVREAILVNGLEPANAAD